MSAGTRPREPQVPVEASRARRWAWRSLALYPVTFVGAFLLGEGLAELLGYPTGSLAAAPLRVVFLAGGPALLLFLVPGVFASYLGRRAMRLGEPRGLVPLVVGATIGLGFMAINVASYLAGRLLVE